MENQKTLVKIRETRLKYINNDTNDVVDVVLVGRLSVAACKEYIKNLGGNYTFILKENLNREFLVDTIALTQLEEL